MVKCLYCNGPIEYRREGTAEHKTKFCCNEQGLDKSEWTESEMFSLNKLKNIPEILVQYRINPYGVMSREDTEK